MALSSKIPPQAYTRDTLVKAIEWLSAQPATVRERATSADLIVSHYLQSRRKSDSAQLDLPISNEDFKSDLRQLAAEFRDPVEPAPPTPTRSPSYILPPPSHLEDKRELSPVRERFASARAEAHPSPQPELMREPRSESRPETRLEYRSEARTDFRAESRHELRTEFRPDPRADFRPELKPSFPPEFRPDATPAAAPTSGLSPTAPVWNIDRRSLEIARELQNRLNLSCEGEAIRMLITMGADRARGLFF